MLRFTAISQARMITIDAPRDADGTLAFSYSRIRDMYKPDQSGGPLRDGVALQAAEDADEAALEQMCGDVAKAIIAAQDGGFAPKGLRLDVASGTDVRVMAVDGDTVWTATVVSGGFVLPGDVDNRISPPEAFIAMAAEIAAACLALTSPEAAV